MERHANHEQLADAIGLIANPDIRRTLADQLARGEELRLAPKRVELYDTIELTRGVAEIHDVKLVLSGNSTEVDALKRWAARDAPHILVEDKRSDEVTEADYEAVFRDVSTLSHGGVSTDSWMKDALMEILLNVAAKVWSARDAKVREYQKALIKGVKERVKLAHVAIRKSPRF